MTEQELSAHLDRLTRQLASMQIEAPRDKRAMEITTRRYPAKAVKYSFVGGQRGCGFGHQIGDSRGTPPLSSAYRVLCAVQDRTAVRGASEMGATRAAQVPQFWMGFVSQRPGAPYTEENGKFPGHGENDKSNRSNGLRHCN